MATCETNGHLWGPQSKCVMCGEPRPDPKRFDKVIASLDEKKHILAMYDGYQALISSHGWRDMMYAPKDKTPFDVITVGSIGIFRAHWLGEKSDLLFVEDSGDFWPAKAIMFRLCSSQQRLGKSE
jgi:hypothetical protein